MTVVFLPVMRESMTRMQRFSASEPDFGLFGLLFLNNLLYLATLGYLVLLLTGQGTPGPNRFGPEPGRMD